MSGLERVEHVAELRLANTEVQECFPLLMADDRFAIRHSSWDCGRAIAHIE